MSSAAMSNALRICAAVLCVLAGWSPVRAAEPARTLIVAHRGLLRHAPENTLANFRACLELRLGFEFDVQRTKDGQLVCIHDDTVDRTRDGKGRVDELTLPQLRQLDAGSWFDRRFAGEKVPTVDEVLKLVAEYRKHEVVIAVDLKAEQVEEEVVRLAQKWNVLPRLVFIGRTISDTTVRGHIRRTNAKAQTAVLVLGNEEIRSTVATEKAEWVYVRFVPTTAEMRNIHVAGKRVFLAGPLVSGNSPDNWQSATAAGISAILTDFPLELRDLMRNAGKKN